MNDIRIFGKVNTRFNLFRSKEEQLITNKIAVPETQLNLPKIQSTRTTLISDESSDTSKERLFRICQDVVIPKDLQRKRTSSVLILPKNGFHSFCLHPFNLNMQRLTSMGMWELHRQKYEIIKKHIFYHERWFALITTSQKMLIKKYFAFADLTKQVLIINARCFSQLKCSKVLAVKTTTRHYDMES